MLPLVPNLYKLIEKKLPHSSDLDKDREMYCNNAVFFLTTSCAESMYWGRYVDENLDSYIHTLIPSKKAALF